MIQHAKWVNAPAYADDKPLWLNKLLRYRRKTLFNEEFVNAGIFDYGHIINLDVELMQYDSIAQKFDLTANNVSFIQFIKLQAAIPLSWVEQTIS